MSGKGRYSVASSQEQALIDDVATRCFSFVDRVDNLAYKWSAESWFKDLKTDGSQTVTWATIRKFLIDMMSRIKTKHDESQRPLNAEITWLRSIINSVHETIKNDGQEQTVRNQPPPPHMIKDKIVEITGTIQTKLHAFVAATKMRLGTEQQVDGKQTRDIIENARTDTDKLTIIRNKVEDLQIAFDTYCMTTGPQRVSHPTHDAVNGELSCMLNKLKAMTDQLRAEETKRQDKSSSKDTGVTKEEQTSMNDNIKRLQEQSGKLQKEKDTWKKDYEETATKYLDLQDSYKLLEGSHADEKQKWDKKLQSLKNDVANAKREYKELQMRYSALAGGKMSEGNPDIADLSDPNRPTRLAERFSELYDNEWTDGFGFLTKKGKSDKEAIDNLMQILGDANNFCTAAVVGVRESLKKQVLVILENSVLSLDERKAILQVQTADKKTRAKTEVTKETGKLDAIKDQKIADLMREYATVPVSSLQKKYMVSDLKKKPFGKAIFSGSSVQKEMVPYIEKCVELFWLMSIQSPPVVIDEKINEYEGKPFDDRYFKIYTKKRDKIDYIVWPFLCIQGGGLLGKGVAQCK